MPEDLNARVVRLEEAERRAWAAIEALAEKQARLDDALATLADAMAESQRREDQRSRQTDERIEKLVSAMGEFIRSGGAPGNRER